MNTKIRPVYMLSIRDTPDLKTHTDKGGDGKSQSTQMETKGKPGQQYTYQTKQTLKQRLKRDKEGHNIITKGSIQEEDITIVSIYAPNIGAPQNITLKIVIKSQENIKKELKRPTKQPQNN